MVYTLALITVSLQEKDRSRVKSFPWCTLTLEFTGKRIEGECIKSAKSFLPSQYYIIISFGFWSWSWLNKAKARGFRALSTKLQVNVFNNGIEAITQIKRYYNSLSLGSEIKTHCRLIFL